MLTPTSTLSDLRQWLQDEAYFDGGMPQPPKRNESNLILEGKLTEEQVEALLQAKEAPPFGSIIFKYGERSLVSSSPIADIQLALKYYHRLSIRRQFGYTLFGSRCKRAWIAARAFYQLGIRTAEPIAVFEWRRFGFLADSSLLVTRVAEGTPLPSYLEQWSHDSDKVEKVAASCREIFDQFTTYQIYHRDTAPKNFIVADDGSVSIIDLDAVQLAMEPEEWKKKHAKDLERFCIVWKRHFKHTAPIFSQYF